MEARVLQSFTAECPSGTVEIRGNQVLIGVFDGTEFLYPLTVGGQTEWAEEDAVHGRIERRYRDQERAEEAAQNASREAG